MEKQGGLVVRIAALVVLAMLMAPSAVRAQDLEAEAWPEFDIWIKMDDTGKNRLYILSSFADEPKFQYEETALGASWDQRFHPNWSWRIGARYVWKAVDPPDKNETRVVLDLKWIHKFGGDWVVSDRNRLDLRRFAGDTSGSYRYRNRIQLEKPLSWVCVQKKRVQTVHWLSHRIITNPHNMDYLSIINYWLNQ